MAAGSIIIDLLMRTGSFETDTKRAEKRLRDFQKSANDFGKKLGTAIGAGAAAGAAALTALTVQAINFADEINDMSQKVGVSTETLSAWGYATKQAGADIEALNTALPRLAKNLAAAADEGSRQAELFKALGVDVKDAAGNLRSVESILPELADRFKQLNNETTEAALAQELLGKSGANLLQFLNEGSDGIKTMTDRARDLGVVIDQETAQAAGEFNDKLDDLRAIALGIGLNIAREVLPAVRELVDWLSKLGKEGSDSAKVFEWIGREAEADVKFIKNTTTAVRELIAIVEGLGRAAAGSWEVTKNLFTLGGASGTYLGGWKKFLGGLKDAADVATMSDAEFLASRDGTGTGASRAGSSRRGGGAMQLDRISGTEASQARINELEELIKEYLEGRGKDKPKGSKLKSDADKLAESFNNLLAQQGESIALFGQQGEAAKIAYQLANSELKNLTDTQKEQLLDNAKWQDFQQEMADIEQAWADAAEDAADARRKHQQAIEDVNAYLDEQIALLGKSAKEQEYYNLAAQAGVSIDSEAGRVIADKVSQLYDQAKALDDQITAMDALRDAGSDFFTDWISGAKSFKDAALDALDSLNKRILQMIADNLMEKLFGEFGTTGTGSTAGTAGGGWGQAIGSFIGSIFGGARAGGGDVWGNRAYLVGEQGPEMFVPNTAGTIIPAGRTAAMTRGGMGGFNQTIINNYQGRPDRRTVDQIASDVGRKSQVAMRRNGAA